MSKLHEDFPPPPFEGFAPAALKFLADLARHQDKAWFAAHKSIYERQVLQPLTALVAELSTALKKTNLPLQGEPKQAIFRINRDLRFSADKRPYKTHAGAVLTRSGSKMSPGLLYFQFDPLGSFVAAGFFRPEAEVLHRLRERLVQKPAEWLKAEKTLQTDELMMEEEDRLIRPPKGFEAAPAALQGALKRKSWIVRRDLTAAECRDPALVGRLKAFAQAAAPLLKFGWAALG